MEIPRRSADTSEALAAMFTCVDGMPAQDGLNEWQMLTFDATLRRRAGVKLGMDCVHVASSKVCGLLVKSVDAGGVVSAWNAESTEPSVFRPGDFVVKVNGVDGNECGVASLAAALRAAGEVVHISVWGARSLEAVPMVASQPTNEFMNERIRWLEERSRACTRSEWETIYVPTLPCSNQNASASTGGSCSVCLAGIAVGEKVRGLACGHYFHLECVGEWFLGDRTLAICCPLCRLPLEQQDSRWASL